MDDRVDDVIAFWFGPGPAPSREHMMRWFRKDPEFDAEIRRRYGALYEAAAGGELSAWVGTARSELALVVLLDQFPRNMFRDDPRAFATDAAALGVAERLFDSGRAATLPLHQRWIAALPFMHAEDRDAQARCVKELEGMVAEARAAGAGELVEALEMALDYGRQHQVIVDRFGRFPHRNAVLGRASTPEELAFLKEPGSSF